MSDAITVYCADGEIRITLANVLGGMPEVTIQWVGEDKSVRRFDTVAAAALYFAQEIVRYGGETKGELSPVLNTAEAALRLQAIYTPGVKS
jgi:hypothetical protein